MCIFRHIFVIFLSVTSREIPLLMDIHGQRIKRCWGTSPLVYLRPEWRRIGSERLNTERRRHGTRTRAKIVTYNIQTRTQTYVHAYLRTVGLHVHYPLSSILYPLFSILCPLSSILYLISSILCTRCIVYVWLEFVACMCEQQCY